MHLKHGNALSFLFFPQHRTLNVKPEYFFRLKTYAKQGGKIAKWFNSSEFRHYISTSSQGLAV